MPEPELGFILAALGAAILGALVNWVMGFILPARPRAIHITAALTAILAFALLIAYQHLPPDSFRPEEPRDTATSQGPSSSMEPHWLFGTFHHLLPKQHEVPNADLYQRRRAISSNEHVAGQAGNPADLIQRLKHWHRYEGSVHHYIRPNRCQERDGIQEIFLEIALMGDIQGAEGYYDWLRGNPDNRYTQIMDVDFPLGDQGYTAVFEARGGCRPRVTLDGATVVFRRNDTVSEATAYSGARSHSIEAMAELVLQLAKLIDMRIVAEAQKPT